MEPVCGFGGAVGALDFAVTGATASYFLVAGNETGFFS